MTTMTSASPSSLAASSGLVDVGIQPSFLDYLRGLWRYRDFIVVSGRSSLTASTNNLALGSAWHILNPLLEAGVFYVIFGVLFSAKDSIHNYPAFLVTGMFVFSFIDRSMQRGARAMIGNTELMAQISFPRAALPVAGVATEFTSFLFEIAAMIGVATATGEPVSRQWALLVPAVVIVTAFNLGLALATGRFAYHYRDIDQLQPHAMRLLRFLSGVFFTTDFVIASTGADSVFVRLFEYNPLHIYMTMFRAPLIEGYGLSLGGWLAGAAWAGAMLAFGIVFFRAHEREYSRG